MKEKFTTLVLAEPADAGLLRQIRQDLSGRETVLHLLQAYSNELGDDADTKSPVFAKLSALFNAGVRPSTMEGYFRGASVTFQSPDLLGVFNVNTLNIVWQVARCLSPWTGKRFDPVEPARLAELTGGCETMEVPTVLGSNTVVFRTAKEKFVRRFMDLMHMWVEEAPEAERRQYGYEARTFFFIGKPAPSILPENRGKPIYQLNYRWKELKTPLPDQYCIDEVVKIADGLHLGQLIYATQLAEPWNPATDPAAYRYRLFGYFLLMDEEWQALRLRIGFDPDNT